MSIKKLKETLERLRKEVDSHSSNLNTSELRKARKEIDRIVLKLKSLGKQ